MEITVYLVITVITLILGEIAKLTRLPNKYIPLQNLLIAALSSIVCIAFHVQDLGILETIAICVASTMSAGGIADLKKPVKKD